MNYKLRSLQSNRLCSTSSQDVEINNARQKPPRLGRFLFFRPPLTICGGMCSEGFDNYHVRCFNPLSPWGKFQSALPATGEIWKIQDRIPDLPIATSFWKRRIVLYNYIRFISCGQLQTKIFTKILDEHTMFLYNILVLYGECMLGYVSGIFSHEVQIIKQTTSQREKGSAIFYERSIWHEY